MATNISKVYLLTAPLEDDMKNTLYFANATSQHDYFAGVIGKTYTNVSYQSETRTFRCKDEIDTIRQYNYIMWQNTAYTNKWFYAFIKKMTFVSGGYTDIEFEVDPLQTYMFDITVKPSFIEREHTNDDTVGNNLIPEGLEHGEYVTNGDPVSFIGGKYYIINADKAPATDGSGNPKNNTPTYYSANVGGVPMSGNLFRCDNITTLTNAFLTYSRMEGGIDHVKNVYMASTLTTDLDDFEFGDCQLDEYVYYRYKGKSTPTERTLTTSAPTTLDGYSPRNKKLLSSPYQYLVLTNNNGSSNTLRYEYFNNRSSITVKTKGIPVVGGSVIAYPKDYKNTSSNYTEGIIAGKLPTLSWSGDAFTNWLTQNAVNIRQNVVKDTIALGVGVGAGIMTGGATGLVTLAGTALMGLSNAKEMMMEMYEHSIIPNSFSGNTNGGDVITANSTNGIYLWKMSITAQFARTLDDFFDMYGYATHRVKTPNVNHRQNWWYTKTVNANITGNVPNDEMNKIKNAYNNGLTFWKNASNFLNYGVSNGIV